MHDIGRASWPYHTITDFSSHHFAYNIRFARVQLLEGFW